jgi:hypothetical protein
MQIKFLSIQGALIPGIKLASMVKVWACCGNPVENSLRYDAEKFKIGFSLYPRPVLGEYKPSVMMKIKTIL